MKTDFIYKQIVPATALLLLIMVVAIILIIFTTNTKYECKDSKCYYVDRNGSKESLEVLLYIEECMGVILSKLQTESDCPPGVRDRIPYCLSNSTLSENIYKMLGTSFTIDKKDIYLCLKDNNNKYYDKNLIMLVAIHEYSHVLCNSQDHTKEFNSINKYILKKAVTWGYYKPIDFETNNIDYCGMKLTRNPI